MGTRADFYLGRGRNAEWLGSIAYDGYPYVFDRNGIPMNVLKSTDKLEFMHYLYLFFRKKDDYISTSNGWPWPWEDSRTTDYSYAFDDGKVYVSCFGHKWKTWEDLKKEEPEEEDEEKEEFPLMGPCEKINWNQQGLILIHGA